MTSLGNFTLHSLVFVIACVSNVVHSPTIVQPASLMNPGYKTNVFCLYFKLYTITISDSLVSTDVVR